MQKNTYGGLLALISCWLLSTPAYAATAWDESVDGDLSTDPAAPTFLTLSTGSNLVWANVQAPNDTRDFVSFTIGAGQSLAAINLEGFIAIGPDSVGYTAINIGAAGIIPSVDTADDFLGGSHLISFPAGTDLLSILAGAPQNGTGFTAPLGPGTYTFLTQQTGTTMIGYGLDFVVVPIPGALWLFATALIAGAGLRQRR